MYVCASVCRACVYVLCERIYDHLWHKCMFVWRACMYLYRCVCMYVRRVSLCGVRVCVHGISCQCTAYTWLVCPACVCVYVFVCVQMGVHDVAFAGRLFK